MPRRVSHIFPLLALLLTAAPRSGRAQSLWIPPDTQWSATVEVLRPNLMSENLSSGYFRGTLYFLTLRLPAPRFLDFLSGFRPRVCLEIPVGHDRLEYYYGTGGSVSREYLPEGPRTFIGNPYFGLEVPTRTPDLFWEIGGRLPLLDEEEPYGEIYFADRDRREAFVPCSQVSVLLNYCLRGNGRWGVRMRGGVIEDRHAEGWGSSNTHGTFLRYGLTGEHTLGPLLIQAGLSGWVNLTLKRGFDAGERTDEQISVGMVGRIGPFRGGLLLYTAPWARDREWIRYTLSLFAQAGW